jgi:CRP-like cAMP-binding protein
MPDQDNERLIRDVPLLAKLAEDDLKALASLGRLRTYRPGAVIFREGDPGDSLHIVVEGAVRIAILSAEGSEATVAILGPGEFVGHLALLDGRPRSASAIAAGSTRTLVVTRDGFRRWLASRPKAAIALLEAMSLQLRRTDEVVTDLAFLGLTQRLAKHVAKLSESRTVGGKVRITQAELASMLGVSRESVNKELNALKRNGIVSLGRGSITILDNERLRALA